MNDKMVPNHICDVLLAPVESSYKFCQELRNPLAVFKRKGHPPTHPILHQPLSIAEHGAVARVDCGVPELSESILQTKT